MTSVDEIVRSQAALFELIPDMRMRVIGVERFSGDMAIVRARMSGTNEEGGAVEQELFYISRIRDGRCVRFEVFFAEQEDAALARFEELRADSSDG
jgi:ketosteroid isomerase-like protein